MKKKELIHIGTFSSPIGLKGEIKINMHTSNFNLFKSFDHYLDESGNNVWDFDYLNFNKNRIIGKLKNVLIEIVLNNLKVKKFFLIVYLLNSYL